MLMVIQPAWYGDPARGSHLGSLYAGIVPHFSTILHWTRLGVAFHSVRPYNGNGMVFWVQWVFGKLFEYLGHLFFHLRFEGLEHLRELDPPVIFVCNHKSWIDHFIIIAGALRRKGIVPIHVLVADPIWAIPVVGWVCKALGAHPARRGQGLDVSLGPLREALSRGASVGLYPEGGIERRKDMFREPKVGPAYLAYHTGRQVFPMAIKGLEQFSWWSLFFRGRTVTIRFGMPFNILPRSNPGDQNVVIEQGRRQVMEEVVRLYRSIAN